MQNGFHKFSLHLILDGIFQLKIKQLTFYVFSSVYKITCARCNSCSIGKTCRHFMTRTEYHVKKDKKTNIYKHLHNNEASFSSFNSDCFSLLDYGTNTISS